MSKLLGKIADIFGGNFIENIAGAVDRFVTTAEEKERLKQELLNLYLTHQNEASKLQLQEMESARNREIEINKSEHAHWLAKLTAPLLALGVSLASVALFVILLFVEVPAEKKDLIVYVLGVLSGVMMMVFGYYFGNSENNKKQLLNGKD